MHRGIAVVDPERPIGRIEHTADFERALGSVPRARSAHFAAHHVAQAPGGPAKRRPQPVRTKLSTSDPMGCTQVVDETAAHPLNGCWVGAVVPKRHARRAVTRNLLRRQIRGALQRHCDRLAPGLWLVRLRSAFDTGRFRSAASPALGDAVRRELDTLLTRAAA